MVQNMEDSQTYFTEQQMQPLASSSHSSTSWPFWFTVSAFSMSAATYAVSEWRL